jgi:hypothetical protein
MARIKGKRPGALMDAAGFDAVMDALIEDFPENAENVERLRALAHEANTTTDPAIHARLDIEYAEVAKRITETAEATKDVAAARLLELAHVDRWRSLSRGGLSERR